jgi:uncharacterized membrane protein
LRLHLHRSSAIYRWRNYAPATGVWQLPAAAPAFGANARNDKETPMLLYATTGIATLVIMLALDALWIGTVALPHFRTTFGDMLMFRAVPGLLFYLLYLAGLLFFVVRPALDSGRWTMAIGYGAFFGLCAYGTYDLTNYATLRPYTLGLTVSDMLWGAFLSATAPALGILVGTYVAGLIRPGG